MTGVLISSFLFLNSLIPIGNSDISLIIEVDKIKSSSGDLKIAIYNSEETYMTESAYKIISVTVDESSSKLIEISSVAPGSYSVCIFHDVNSNGILDKNILGIPTEPYGFSNNPTLLFGPPDFDRTKFNISSTSNEGVVIHLK